MSLETFYKKATVHNAFNESNFWSQNAVIQLINDKITVLKSGTRLDCALEKTNREMFTKKNGAGFGGFNVLVLLSDGRTRLSANCDNITSSIKDLKVTIIQLASFQF